MLDGRVRQLSDQLLRRRFDTVEEHGPLEVPDHVLHRLAFVVDADLIYVDYTIDRHSATSPELVSGSVLALTENGRLAIADFKKSGADTRTPTTCTVTVQNLRGTDASITLNGADDQWSTGGLKPGTLVVRLRSGRKFFLPLSVHADGVGLLTRIMTAINM